MRRHRFVRIGVSIALAGVAAACAVIEGDVLPGSEASVEISGALNGSNEDCVCGSCPGSPIVLDVAGDGFDLTDAAHGVLFDLPGDGTFARWAWTASDSDDAWLALDRDGDGAITSGRELFGNFTDQPASVHRNGYLALGVFDDNGDHLIDARDAVFDRLRLWRDADHDGASSPDELHTLAEFGIVALSTDYRVSARVDPFGNVYRYRSHLRRRPDSRVNPITYDVFLSRADAPTPAAVFTDARGTAVQMRCGDPPPPPRCRSDWTLNQHSASIRETFGSVFSASAAQADNTKAENAGWILWDYRLCQYKRIADSRGCTASECNIPSAPIPGNDKRLVALYHAHPNGNPYPSDADKMVSTRHKIIVYVLTLDWSTANYPDGSRDDF